MAASDLRRLVLPNLGSATDGVAARVLRTDGTVLAVVAEPDPPPDAETLREAVVRAAIGADFEDAVLAGVAFAPRWGGDAVGFT